MFYISDINGVLTPYDPEKFRIEREARILAEVQRAERELEATGTIEDHNEAASLRAARDVRDASPSNSSASSAAGLPEQVSTGIAGASMLHRQERSTKSDAEPVNKDQREKIRQEHLLRHLLRPAAKLSKNVNKDEPVAPHKNPYAKLDEPQPARHKALCVREIMSSDVYTLTAEQKIEVAGEVFRTHRFRHIPIVSGDTGKLIGIFSDRDYLSATDKSRSIGSHMATAVLTARPETEIRSVAEIMFEHRIGAMPVLDEAGELAGVVTRSDILCALVHGAPLELWV